MFSRSSLWVMGAGVCENSAFSNVLENPLRTDQARTRTFQERIDMFSDTQARMVRQGAIMYNRVEALLAPGPLTYSIVGYDSNGKRILLASQLTTPEKDRAIEIVEKTRQEIRHDNA